MTGNVKENGAGFVTRFQVNSEFVRKYPVQTVGGRTHTGLWVPAADLAEFNRNIIGRIEITRRFGVGGD